MSSFEDLLRKGKKKNAYVYSTRIVLGMVKNRSVGAGVVVQLVKPWLWTHSVSEH